MTDQQFPSDWHCDQCGEVAVEATYEEAPRCDNPACPFYRSIIPNYIH
jgi:hypothetical protein